MLPIENIDTIKLLLAIITFISGLNIGLVSFAARKYIKRIDDNDKKLSAIETEHKIFHKCETGIN